MFIFLFQIVIKNGQKEVKIGLFVLKTFLIENNVGWFRVKL